MEGALGSPSSWALPAARAVHDAALTLLFGGLLFPTYALAKGERRVPAGLLAALRIEAWVALASAGVVYALGVAGMAGSLASALDGQLLATTMLGDSYGQLFGGRAVLLLACALLLARPHPSVMATWLAGAALAALCLTGHAVEGAGWKPRLHEPLDALHLLSAGLWIGALPWFGVLLSPRFDPQAALAAVRRFSGVAGVAVAVLLITGAGATLLLVGSPLNLAATAWGWLLIGKSSLAAVMVGLAAHNRWRITPLIDAHDPAAAVALRRNARLELGLALLILAVVGLLGTLPFEPMAM